MALKDGNVYQSTSVTSKVMKKIKKGQKISYIGISDKKGWLIVVPKDKICTVGYIHEVLLNGGHRVFDTSDPTDRGWKRVMWNENEINDFYLVEQVYEDYKKFCRDQNITKYVGTK